MRSLDDPFNRAMRTCFCFSFLGWNQNLFFIFIPHVVHHPKFLTAARAGGLVEARRRKHRTMTLYKRGLLASRLQKKNAITWVSDRMFDYKHRGWTSILCSHQHARKTKALVMNHYSYPSVGRIDWLSWKIRRGKFQHYVHAYIWESLPFSMCRIN